MWLVVAGPLAVVVAGFVTAWIAIDGADASLPNVPPARGVARSAVNARSDAPAQQARNHVATPAPTPAAADSTEPTARRP